MRHATLLAGGVVTLDWGGRRLLLLWLLLALPLHLLGGAVLPTHAIVGFHASGLRTARLTARSTLALLPFFGKLWVLVFVVFVVPLRILVLFFVLIPDRRCVAMDPKGMLEVDASGIL